MSRLPTPNLPPFFRDYLELRGGGIVFPKNPLPNCEATKLLDSFFTWLSFVASPSTLPITVDGSGIRLAPVEVGSFISSLLRRFLYFSGGGLVFVASTLRIII